jgi:hypothetical protein
MLDSRAFQHKSRKRPLRVPSLRSGYRKERMGIVVSHHLRDSAEVNDVNVGGSPVEMSRPSTKPVSVGGVGGL